MTPVFRDELLDVYIGDAFAAMAAIDPGSMPSELVVRPILSCVPPGGTVLDPFAGTGTVGAVANSLGRRAILVELDRRNLDAILERTVRSIDFALLGIGAAAADPAPAATLGLDEAIG